MKKKTGGMTIVEVIVAFAVLMIGLSGLYKAVQLSGNMVIKAGEIQQQVDELMNDYYRKELEKTTEQDVNMTISSEYGSLPSTWKLSLKDGENEEGYHIYYFERPKSLGEGE